MAPNVVDFLEICSPSTKAQLLQFASISEDRHLSNKSMTTLEINQNP
ncbi:hypothetical protein NPIL_491351, partial [Nephila pilipes]